MHNVVIDDTSVLIILNKILRTDFRIDNKILNELLKLNN